MYIFKLKFYVNLTEQIIDNGKTSEWLGGGMNGWKLEVKAILRIAYSNQIITSKLGTRTIVRSTPDCKFLLKLGISLGLRTGYTPKDQLFIDRAGIQTYKLM